MNFVAIYTDDNGCDYRIKTYTYVEALSIIKNASTRGYTACGIEALNDFADIEMKTFAILDETFKPVLSKLINDYIEKE